MKTLFTLLVLATSLTLVVTSCSNEHIADAQSSGIPATNIGTSGVSQVDSRFATLDEEMRLESLEETKIPISIVRDNSESTTVLTFQSEDGYLHTCYLTPLKITSDRIVVRLADQSDGIFRAAIISLNLATATENTEKSVVSMEIATVGCDRTVRIDPDSEGLVQLLSSYKSTAIATSWWDCFLRCVAQKVHSYWWLNAICGAGSPINIYYCILGKGAVSWAIISWCIGSASGYCP